MILKIKDASGNVQEVIALRGKTGQAGITPHIGTNGNWWIGETDTGVKAQGAPGADYVLTDADKTEIAQIAVGLLPKYAGEVVDA